MKSSKNTIGLYIHWPYCLSKCPYCDFASSVCKQIDEDILLSGYIRDMDNLLNGGKHTRIRAAEKTGYHVSCAQVDKDATESREGVAASRGHPGSCGGGWAVWA